MNKKIITNLNDGVYEIILNNPAKMNCMGIQMLQELFEAIEHAENNKSIHIVVIKGEGEKAFSSGADLNEFKSLTDEEVYKWVEFGNEVFNKIENFKKPTIAFINGYAIGGGLELALACDFRVGTETTIISCPELQHGWLPGWGGMTRLRRLTGEVRAKEIIMLGEKISAYEALKIGLLNRIDSSDKVELKKLIKQLIKLKAKSFELAKKILQDTNRTTGDIDVKFDALATQITK
jgi:enoyl-CoA hydratase/carnithine racemase